MTSPAPADLGDRSVDPYFHAACGHRHTAPEDAAACPDRGWSMIDRAPYSVIRVSSRP